MRKIVTLTTDFGLSDPWVAVMKGVMLSIEPEITFVDISHNIPPQDVLKGALCLGGIKNFFPEGSVHLAVVDPGVGTTREPVIIKTRRYFYVGPNNGLFSFLDSPVEKAVKIANIGLLQPQISVTFHGRDIFAPAAARLFSTPMEEFGPAEATLEKLSLPEPVIKENIIKGEITYIDRFGNLFTNITAETLRELHSRFPNSHLEVKPPGVKIINGVSYYYHSVASGELGVIVNSLNLLELFTPNGNAGECFGLKPGDTVTVRFVPAK